MITELFTDTKKPYRFDRDVILQAKELNIQLNNANCLFNHATDSLDIEAAIYRIKELEIQYAALLNRAKLEKICGNLQFGSEKL